MLEQFMRMLDELTPYCQARMQWLSGQQRKIVEYLVQKRATAQVKEIAEQCFLSPQATSAQLKELREKGYVVSHEVGRDAFYELKEPLMRLAMEAKKNRGDRPIRFFVELLRLLYRKEELIDRLETLS